MDFIDFAKDASDDEDMFLNNLHLIKRNFTIMGVGRTGRGKSRFLNFLSFNKINFPVGHEFTSKTDGVQMERIPYWIDGQPYELNLIDTQGIGDNRLNQTDA